jgi:hypothetical protein
MWCDFNGIDLISTRDLKQPRRMYTKRERERDVNIWQDLSMMSSLVQTSWCLVDTNVKQVRMHTWNWFLSNQSILSFELVKFIDTPQFTQCFTWLQCINVQEVKLPELSSYSLDSTRRIAIEAWWLKDLETLLGERFRMLETLKHEDLRFGFLELRPLLGIAVGVH